MTNCRSDVSLALLSRVECCEQIVSEGLNALLHPSAVRLYVPASLHRGIWFLVQGLPVR